MDVLAQASNVVERAEATHGRVTLVLNLDDPAQRAAYAAALAVLQISGFDPLASSEWSSANRDNAEHESAAGDGAERTGKVPARSTGGQKPARTGGEPAGDERDGLSDPIGSPNEAGGMGEDHADGPADAAIRRSYAEALGELTTDAARAEQIVRETYPRVRELLRDGANVEAVAQIQYRRWTEEHLDTVRS